MKRLVLILSVVLASALSMSAQYHGKDVHKHHHNRHSRAERIDKRIDNLTNKMVESYGLSEEQSKKLLILNKEFYENKRVANRYRHKAAPQNRGYHGNGQACCVANDTCLHMHQRGVKERSQSYDKSKMKEIRNQAVVTPMLYKQYRINKLQKEVETYQDGLKQIFTKKQYKEYQKRMEDSLKEMN